MDAAAIDGAGMSVESMMAIKQGRLAGEVQAGMVKKSLDLQKELMAALFRDMGLGQTIDVQA